MSELRDKANHTECDHILGLCHYKPFEDLITDLESQLADAKEHSDNLISFYEKEIDRVKEDYQSQIEQLKQENSNLTHELNAANFNWSEGNKQITNLKAENARLSARVKAFRTYLHHLDSCIYEESDYRDCSCGLWNLRELKEQS
jgi:predicted nuclease with TOPRIM domain